MIMEKDRNTFLVLGGTGKTGRRVVERLVARNLPVRVGSRTAEPRFDWERPEPGSPRCGTSERSTSHISRTSRDREQPMPSAPLRRLRWTAVYPVCLYLRTRRVRSGTLRSNRAGMRSRLDAPPGELVLSEFQRGLYARAAPGRRTGPSRGRRG